MKLDVWFHRRKPALEPASTENVIQTLNLADAMRVLMVEKVKAEIELERMKLDERRADADRRASGRERQREAGRNRAQRAKRSQHGSFLPNSAPETQQCKLCRGARGWGLAELEEHRRHKSSRQPDVQ